MKTNQPKLRMRITMVVSVLWIQLAVWLFGQHPITAMPQDEAEDTSGACAPRDCVYSEWTLWSDCTEECGDAGVRQRVRHLLSDGGCGSTCNGSVAESEPCNVRCCPTNCAYSPWNAWLYCRCSDNECEQVGNRYVCLRNRQKVVQESCGGYCDDVTIEERCGNPCCYRDCAMGAWAPWSDCRAACEQPGVKFRNRTVLQEPECGGTRCDYESDQRHCTGGCCPVDCAQGPWSAWSLCPATCGTGRVTRTRFVQRAECGGVQCLDNTAMESKDCEQYNNVDCKVSPWSVWSECQLFNGKCGEGSRTRSRTVLVAAECRGAECPELLEEGACSGECCVTDCSVSDWSEFGYCSTTCGEGKRNSTREVLVEASCGGVVCPELIRFESCVEQNVTDCKFTEWTQWSRCDNDCGSGRETRTRTLLTPAYCGGDCPSMHTEETRDCQSFDARADCEVGEWGAWSECVRDCDRGVISRTRSTVTSDACGGVACSNYNLTETDTCHERCEQLCNQAVCSCSPGWLLQADRVTCKRRTCDWPKLRYCGPGTVPFKSCTHVHLQCHNGTEFESRCVATCLAPGWVVKGGEPYITCLDTGHWDSPTIFCGPPNKAPLNISVNTQEVSELLKDGECFGTLTTLTDDEPWDKHHYEIVKDGSNNLKVEGDHLCCIRSFDFESSGLTSWQTTVRSTDLDGLSVDREFTFTLLNENDPPRSVNLSPDRVAENSAAGTVVGCLYGKDDDPGQVLSFFIVKSINKLFQLFRDERNNTCVRVSKDSDPRCYTEGGSWCLLNYEKQSDYYIAVMVRDNGSPMLSSYFDVHIRVEDVNEPITGISIQPSAVPESVRPGHPLVKLLAEDEDRGQGHEFRIVGDPSGLFSTDGESLTASVTFDYEQDPARQFVITVGVTDDGSPPMEAQKELVFGVGDKNESPYNLMITGADSSDMRRLTLRENMPDTLIGTVSVYDPDAGDSITLSVSSPAFSLQNTRCAPLKGRVYNYCSAQLVSTEGVDFETTPSLTVTVIAMDDNFHRLQEEFTVEVLDQNDPPTDILVDGRKVHVVDVQEQKPGARVADIRVVDEDVNDTHALFLSGSASSQFTVSGGQLWTTHLSSLDYESRSPLTLVITAIDGGQPGQSVVKTFSINVTDVNEQPTDVSLSSNQVAENSPAGTVVATLTTLDPDNAVNPHQNFTYRLLDDANGRFRVAGDQLLVSELAGSCLSAHCSLNHEVLPDLLLKIQSTDDGSPPLSVVAPVIVSVSDVNDKPSNMHLSKNTVRENKAPGTLVGSIIADDEDAMDVLTFTLLNGSDVFSIKNNNMLVTLQELDYETNQSFVLSVRVADNGHPPATVEATVTVLVEDDPEPPVFNTPAVISVVENEPAGSSVGAVLVSDPDLDDHLDIMLYEPSESFMFGKPTCINDESGTRCNVTLMTSVVLEFEAQSEYALDVTAADSQGHAVVKVLTVIVTDTNDPPTDVLVDGMSVERVSVAEGATGAQWDLTVVDEDRGQEHNISISQQHGDHFRLQATTLTVTTAFDHETEPESVVVLTVTDSGSPPRSMDKSITVIVEDVNEAPSGLTLSASKVKENSPGGTVIGQLLGTDPDLGQTLTFSLQDDAGQRFAIDGDRLVVKGSGPCGADVQQPCRLNYEAEVSHKVTVMVTDSGAPRKHATFDLDIEVTDANDPPYNMQLRGSRVDEVAPVGTPVGELSVEDEDQGQTHSFQLLDDAAGLFKMGDENTVVKATDERLDVQKVYSIRVKATDSGSAPAETEKTFYLTVSGVNEAPAVPTLTAHQPALLSDPATLQVPETFAANTSLATVSSVDNDPDSTLTFTLLEDGDGQFALGESVDCEVQGDVTSCALALVLTSSLDYESRAAYQLLVQVQDSDMMQATLAVSVSVTDVNEPPQSVVFVTGEIQAEENAGGLTLGSFSALDPDGGDTHTFLLTHDDGDHFTLTPTGLLATAQGPGLDYEEEHYHPITVQVTDSAGNTLQQHFNVTVLDLNENPTNLTLEPNNTVVEMAVAESVIGRLVVQDPDNEGVDGVVQRFSFKLLSDHDGRFRIDGDKLKVMDAGKACSLVGGAACLLDYETKPTHHVIVAVTDSSAAPITQSFVVEVRLQDVNDRPTPPFLDELEVSESTEVGSVVGDLSSSDQDQGQTLVYDLVGESAVLFSVRNTSLVLASKLDYEGQKKVEVTVRVTDDGEPPLSSENTITISVEDVNERPREIKMVAKPGGVGVDFETDQPVIMEDTERGATVAQLVVLDPDLHEEMTVLLSSYVVAVGSMSCLSLTKGSRCVGDVTLGRLLDYEEQMTWSVDVTAVDGGGLKIEKAFNITVGDSNDPPTDLLINGKAVSSLSVPENSQDVVLATLGAVDPDADQQHTYTVQGTALFYIAGDKLQVTSAATLDYEETSEYKVKVMVTDTGTPPLSFEKDVVISVTDVNEPPTDVKLSINKVSEDSQVDNVVGQLTATDPDNARSPRQTHSYALTNDAEGRFAVEGDLLVVREARFSYETEPSVSIIVAVTDSGEEPLTAEFPLLLHVLDANDPPNNLRLNMSSIPEDTAVGTVVGELAADDVDKGQTLRYTMGRNAFFVVSGNKILVDGRLDFETSPHATLEIQVTDSGSPPKSTNSTFTAEITDVNEEPSVITLTSSIPDGTMAIPEDTEVDEVIALLTTFDPDTVDFVSINVTSPSDPRLKLEGRGTLCEQRAENGSVQTACSVHVQLAHKVDYEAGREPVRLEVRTMDKGGLGRTEGWTFTVADSNDKPTAILIEGNTTEIPENEASFVLGELICLDPDPGDSHTFQLLTGWDAFRVAPGSVLTVAKALNYERQRRYDVMVRCKDSGEPSETVTKTLTFTVKNVNEKPDGIALSHTEVSMTARKDSIVGFLRVSDPDNVGLYDRLQQHACVVDSDEDILYIDETRNTLRVSDKIPAQRNAVVLTVTCTDDGQPPLSLTQELQVLIVETADVPKEVRLLGTRVVPENQPPAVVGRIVVVNLLTEDPMASNYTCSDLKVKETDELVLAIEGENLVTKQPLDFEEWPYLTVTLTCRGLDVKGDETQVDGELTVRVLDVNEPPTEIRVYGGGEVEENSPPGTLVAQLNTLDPEPYQNYTYTLLAVAAGLDPSAADPGLSDVFAVSGRSLAVGPGAAGLNYEVVAVFSLSIQSQDDGAPPLSVNATVIVEVKDVNDPPTSVSLATGQVAENSEVGTVVGHLEVTDEDEGQVHRCQVTNLQDVPFTIKNSLDLVVSKEDIDYETARTYVVEVSCQDDGADGSHLRVTASLTVNVTDVNEAPYDVRLSNEHLAENSPPGQVVGEIMATDPDSEKVTFSMDDGTDYFTIDGDNTLTALATFNYEEVASVAVTIRATDNQGLHTVKRFLIQIDDVNDPPTSLSLSSHVVSESTPPGDEVAMMLTEDPDVDQTFTFLLAPDPAVNGHFAVSGHKLVVGQLGVDFESSSAFRVKVTAVDSGVPPRNITKEFDIEVTDENEAPTDIVTTPLAPVPENVTVPHVLTSLTVIDEDAEQRHSCHLAGPQGPLSVDTREDGSMTLVVQARLDYETAPRYDVVLSCSDGMYDVTKNLVVEVLDVNEAPTLLTLSGPHALPATVTGDYEVGTISVSDPDSGQTHTLVIKGPNSDLLVIRSGSRLVLTKAIPVEVLSMPSPAVTVTVTATDSGQPPLGLQQSFTLPVTDVDLSDLQLPSIVISSSRVAEDAVAGTEVGALYDLNHTISDTVHFTLLKDKQNLFEIKDNQMLVLSRNMSTFTGRSAEVTLQARNTRTGETAERTITVLVTRSDKCYRDGRTCDDDARCVALNDTVSQCQCDEDFTGDGYTCTQINDCIREDGTPPCQHGHCVDGILDFKCVCQDGYSGSLCEIEENRRDPCSPNPCSHGSACLPDSTNTSYSCTCAPGWLGARCEDSVDDCATGWCHGADSTCVDDHLTYLCRCGHDRRGPRCEYLKAACPEASCEDSEVCVPEPDHLEHTCVTPDNLLSFFIRCRESGITDMEVCKVRFLDFVRIYGRFPQHAKSASPRKLTASRSRRAAAMATGSQHTPGVHVYLERLAQTSDGALNATLLVLDAEGLVFSTRQVLDALHDTCESIKVEGLRERPFCPAIQETYRSLAHDDDDVPDDGGGAPVGLIAGAGGGLLVIVIIIVVVVVIVKKRKNKSDADHQTLQECAAPPHPPVDDPDWQLSNNGSLTLPSSTLTPDGLKATQGYTNAAERTGDAKALRSMK